MGKETGVIYTFEFLLYVQYQNTKLHWSNPILSPRVLNYFIQVNENGEVVKKEESGPWNKKDAERTNSNELADSPVVEVKALPGSDPPNVVGGTYVPPNRRDTSSVAPMRAEEKRPRKYGVYDRE